ERLESAEQPVAPRQVGRPTTSAAQADQLLLEQEILRDHRAYTTGATEPRGYDGQVQQREQEIPRVSVSVGPDVWRRATLPNPRFSARIVNSRPTATPKAIGPLSLGEAVAVGTVRAPAVDGAAQGPRSATRHETGSILGASPERKSARTSSRREPTRSNSASSMPPTRSEFLAGTGENAQKSACELAHACAEPPFLGIWPVGVCRFVLRTAHFPATRLFRSHLHGRHFESSVARPNFEFRPTPTSFPARRIGTCGAPTCNAT